MATNRLPSLDQVDPKTCWQPWQPDERQPFDLKWAGHLYRRATFGASLAELRQATKRGFEPTLNLICAGGPGAADEPADFHKDGDAAIRGDNQANLRTWWLYCMLNSVHPLREKMTLFWHNHFATSINKVNSTSAMLAQNKLLRNHALGKFGPLVLEISKDPAMLIWLDSNNNLKGKPNENYAREVMELFSLGVGNYKEKDIREAARAFTGWHTNGSEFEFSPRFHDDGEKTILGQTGNWNGEDVIRICLEQKACAEFLAGKLFRYFISEAETPTPELLAPLADSLRMSGYDIAGAVRMILASKLFFSEHAFRQKIKSPVEYVLGSVLVAVGSGSENQGKAPPGVLVAKLESMGQSLFAPPNVKGWPGGKSWLNTSTMLVRSNFGQDLAMGLLWGRSGQRPTNSRLEELLEAEREAIEAQESIPIADAVAGKKPQKPVLPEEPAPAEKFDVAAIIRSEKAISPDAIVDLLLNVYLPGGVGADARKKLIAFVGEGKPTGPKLDRRIRETVHALLAMPEYQLD